MYTKGSVGEDSQLRNTTYSSRAGLCLIATILFLVAAVIRIPNLYRSPGFIEANELEVTLSLAHGERFPLHNQNPHIGAFSNYLVAVFFSVFGLHWWVPRIVSLLAGTITVPVLFFLGRKIFDTTTGILAASLLLFSMFHVLIISHVPWSNHFTPLFATSAILCFITATSKWEKKWFAAGGLLFGIGLQTHPSMITLAPVILLIVLFSGETPILQRFRSVGPLIAAITAAAGAGNLLYYNITTKLHGVKFGLEYPVYAIESNPDAQNYMDHLSNAFALLLKVVSGVPEVHALYPVTWLTIAVMFSWILILIGVIDAIRRRKWILPALLLTPLFVIPVVSKAYEFCQFGRYMGFLMPASYLLMASAFILIYRTIRRTRFAVFRYGLFFILAFMLSANADQYLKLSSEEIQLNPSMLLFAQTAQILKRQNLSDPVLVDRNAFKSHSLLVFLECDGWNAGLLPGSMLKKERVLKNLKVNEERITLPHSNAIVVSSPELLPYLLKSDKTRECLGCLIKAKGKNATIQKRLDNSIYYFVRMSKVAIPLHEHSEVSALRIFMKQRKAADPQVASKARAFFRRCDIWETNISAGKRRICVAQKVRSRSRIPRKIKDLRRSGDYPNERP